MADLCAECNERPQFLSLRQQAQAFDEDLRGRFTNEIGPGGAVFIGKHYAHSKHLLFTLNPRPTPSDRTFKFLRPTNHHWNSGAKTQYRNLTFGSYLFKKMVEAAPQFQPSLDLMTDQFIVPWRSLDWAAMRRSPAWPAIRKASAELCRLSVQHHRPELVFTSGKITRNLLFEFMGVARPKPVDVRRSHNKSWDCEWFPLEVPAGPLNVVRLPHFSRAGYEEFAAIAEWVVECLPGSTR